ncbi:RsfA family transcriptional regulator [Schinkia sp. CFF1]
MKVRQDAWSHEDDLLLAETVLRHIREGSTQLNAFDEVGDKLNRTSAACGFRWNAEVRKKYHQAMELAKKQRKERKRALALQVQERSEVQPNSIESVHAQVQPNERTQTYASYYDDIEEQPFTKEVETMQEMATELNLETVISYLYSIKNMGINSHILQSENDRLNKENKHLVEEKEKLDKKLQRLKQENRMIQEDYQSLVQIMDRARRMVSFSDEGNISPQVFTEQHDTDYGQIAK